MTPLVVPLTISVIIPTFKREKVLIATLSHVLSLLQLGDEILVIDQTLHHEQATTEALQKMAMRRNHWLASPDSPAYQRGNECRFAAGAGRHSVISRR